VPERSFNELRSSVSVARKSSGCERYPNRSKRSTHSE
jgi:hypothetical protein